MNVPYVKKGDNIGVALDLTVPIITFFFNGMKIPGTNATKLFTAVIYEWIK